MNSCTPSSNRNGKYVIRLEQLLKALVNYMKWPKYQWSPFLLYCFLSSSLHQCVMVSSLLSVDRGREDSALAYRRFCTICRYHLQYMHLQYSPSLGHSWRTVVKGNPSSGQDFRQCTWLCPFSEGKMTRCAIMCNYILMHGFWPVVWLDGQGLGRNITGKLVTRKFEEICG